MRIVFLLSENLPVPAVLGGAVEGLVQSLLKIGNTRANGPEFAVISNYHKEAVNSIGAYSRTKFLFIRNLPLNSLIQKVWNKICLWLLKQQPTSIFLYRSLSRIAKSKADILVIENRPEFVLTIRKRFPNLKIALHLHNDTLSEFKPDGLSIVSQCDAVFCISEYIKNRVLSLRDTPTDKVFVLRNGVDVELFKKAAACLPPDLKKPLICYVGRVSESKGVGVLVDAFRCVLSKFKNCKLMIVGSSWYGNNISEPFLFELQERTKDLKDNILFTGYIHQDQLPASLAAAAIQVVPSLWAEPAGMTVLEALSMEIPVIATRVGGIPEYLSDDIGTLFDLMPNSVANLSQAIDAVLVDYEKATTKAQKGRIRIVESFSLDQFYNHFIELLEVI